MNKSKESGKGSPFAYNVYPEPFTPAGAKAQSFKESAEPTGILALFELV
jgi:hypothetical protein